MQMALISFALTEKKNIERKTFILSHKREYGLSSILNIAETVGTHTKQKCE